ncbi:aminodeoxychorismate lyase [Coriobacterium glomerans PW2]|uniref:Endolytic murein transglycosylase n=1 Tax=Coriobacterium glomerans (strain ATCC 49209 / DSM 20642 / JCM 10262 / PW2) TaxID=700015 RepID=F2N7Z9_CORGP|nr:endolytic transglycosylase MltG [Coriobacterium glomerans]AEB07108.1 aminodeoxychorismate lyase [Coriobacterium glomerans PW2]
MPSIVAIVAIVGVIAAGALLILPRLANLGWVAPESSVASGQPVEITIPQGSAGTEIASLLKQDHVIESATDFEAEVKRQMVETQLKPGKYSFVTGQDLKSVVETLAHGSNVEGVKLVIQEGLTVKETAAKVEETFGIARSDFLAQARASNYVGDYSFLANAYDDSLEGYLYPKTYSFTEKPTADQIIRALLDQFKAETADLDLDKGANGLDARQIVTMASLVERETAEDTERPKVASVIYNRLAKPMRLKIDAAIVYARGGGNQAVSSEDLGIESPYNLYKHDGLPPGPICSPSISSIRAALRPAKTDYLYYVLSSWGAKTHRFTSDDSEFAQFAQEYQDSRP